MYKAKDLRDQSINELEATYKECAKQLFDLTNQYKGLKRNDKPHEIKNLHKDIARLLTVISEKKREEKLNAA